MTDISDSLSRLWENGVLCDLSVSMYRGRADLTPEDIGADATKASQEPVQIGHKRLFADETLKPLRQAEAKARNALVRYSFGFPVGGARFVPLTAWNELEAILKEAALDFDLARMAFLESFQENRDTMIATYPSLLKLSDYPAPDTLRFGMDYNTFTLSPSSAGMAAKLQASVDTFLADTVATLRAKVYESCEAASARIGEGKPISEKTLNGLRSMATQFSSLNFVGDKSVEAAIADLRQSLSIYTAKEMRESPASADAFKRVLDLVANAAHQPVEAEESAIGFFGRTLDLGEPLAAHPPSWADDGGHTQGE
jgi:hypothetical protein